MSKLPDLKINLYAGLVLCLPFLLDLIYGPYHIRLWMLSVGSVVFIVAFNLGKWALEKQIWKESREGIYISRYVLPKNMKVNGSYQVISFTPGEWFDSLSPTPSYFILESIPEKFRFHVYGDHDFTLPKKFQVSMHTHTLPGGTSVEYRYTECR